MQPPFKSTTAKRRAAERAAHKFSDDIGGHASNYREPPAVPPTWQPFSAWALGYQPTVPPWALGERPTVPPMVHTNIKDQSPVKDATTGKPLAPKPERG